MVARLCAHLDLQQLHARVRGGGAQHALKALGADPSRALYVGDSGVDSETAKNASLPCVLCDWGYWDRDRLENCAALGIISAPAELLQYV